jgi:CubicO group peptidase (beta-lactamase class C family)
MMERSDRFVGVSHFIREQLEVQQVPSLAVAVARGGQILWEEGFGWADRERRIPATEHTIYSLASVSKPITATGLMVLREQGKIDLDRPANDYLGNAKLHARVGDARDATVRRVASHTAGLPLHFQFFFADEPYRPPEIEETIRRYGNLVTAPGETFTYSNLGYGVLGHLLSRVSGRSWGEFLRAEVFAPLGMTRTAVEVPAGLAESVAVRYGRDGLPLPDYTTDHPGASAVFSSAHDLVRFGLFHTPFQLPGQEAILSCRAIKEMQRPAGNTEADRIYGLGWFLGASRTGQASIAHAGGMDGVSTRLYLVPSEGVVIVILSNADTELPGQVFREILPALLGDAAREGPAAAGPGRSVRPRLGQDRWRH